MLPGVLSSSGIVDKEKIDPGPLLLAPGSHREEASIDTHCPCVHSQGSPPKAASREGAGELQQKWLKKLFPAARILPLG